MWGRCWWTFRGHLALFDSTDDLSNTALLNFSQTDLREHTSLKGYLICSGWVLSSTYHRCKWGSSAKTASPMCVRADWPVFWRAILVPFEPNPHFVSSFVWQWPLHNTTHSGPPLLWLIKLIACLVMRRYVLLDDSFSLTEDMLIISPT